MTIDQMNYVLEVERTRSINKAANNLFISQSALSLAIQNLEKELGQQIFVRTNRGVIPTSYGKSLIRYITPIQMQLHQVDTIFSKNKADNMMSFTLANDGFQVASDAFLDLFLKYESVGVYMKQLDSYDDEAKSLVSNGQADVGFMRLWSCYKKIEKQQLNAMGLIYQQVCNVGLAVVVGPHNPLYYKEIKYVSPDMLKDFPIIQYGFMNAGPYNDIIDRVGLAHSDTKVVSSSRAVVSELIAKTDAYYLTADTFIYYEDEEYATNKRNFPLQDTDIRAELGWISQRGNSLNPLALEYIKLLEQRFI
jgi:DNA-binding transcriptional LysR family regulator